MLVCLQETKLDDVNDRLACLIGLCGAERREYQWCLGGMGSGPHSGGCACQQELLNITEAHLETEQ